VPPLFTMPNAGPQPLPEAGAQRTLEAVAWTPVLGQLQPTVLFPLRKPSMALHETADRATDSCVA